MSTETEKLNYEAGQAIGRRDYGKAIAAVLDGSGDLQLAALLAIARELAITAALIPNAGKGV